MNLTSTYKVIITSLLLFCMLRGTLSAQMCGSGASTNKGVITITTSWQNTSPTGDGERPYWSFTATAGNIYSFSNCSGPSEGTTINIHNAAMNNVGSNSGNGPHCASQNASINWTCTTSGTYYIQLVRNGCAKLQNNQILSYKYASTCTTPGTPTAVTASAAGMSTANLSWAAGSPSGSATVTYYWVLGTSNTVVYGSGVAQGTTTGTTAVATGLSCNTNYYLRVYAQTSCNSSASAYATSAVFTTALPGSPVAVSDNPVSICSGTETNLIASQPGSTINWYDSPTGGSLLYSSGSDSAFTYQADSSIVLYAEAYVTETCISESRTPFNITTASGPIAGMVSGGGLMCPGNAGGQLVLTGHKGTISQWEVSNDYGASWTPIASTDSVYTATIRSSGVFWFRAEITNGQCPSVKSAHAEVSVPAVQGISQISGNSVTCNITSPNDWVDILDPANNLIVSLFDSTGNNNLGNTSAELTIDPIVSYHPNTGEPYLQRHIKINVSSQGGAYVKLYFTQEELASLMGLAPSIQSASDLAVTKYSDMQSWSNPKYFSDPVITANDPFPGVFSVQVGVSEFSEFFIHAKNGQGPLPIELISFEANCNNGTATLSWATATESNNQYFTVERTADMLNWIEVARVEGAGNSNRILNYSTTDENRPQGMVYYRLKQTDYDGMSTTSTAVPLNCDGELNVEVNCYPNPFRDELLVAFDKGISKSASVMMYDASAKIILSRLLTETDIDRGVVVLSVSDVIPGIYTAEFISGKIKKAMTVVKSK